MFYTVFFFFIILTFLSTLKADTCVKTGGESMDVQEYLVLLYFSLLRLLVFFSKLKVWGNPCVEQVY